MNSENFQMRTQPDTVVSLGCGLAQPSSSPRTAAPLYEISEPLDNM